MVAERVHAQWFASKPGHTAEGMLARMRGGRRLELPIGLVAFVDGAPAGTVSLLEQDLEERLDLRPWLAGLLVFPDFRSQGVGTALLRAIMEIGAEIGFETLYLYTEKPQFYRRLGWEILCEVRSDPGSSVLSCRLPGAATKSA